jgi:glycogen phosphorylase
MLYLLTNPQCPVQLVTAGKVSLTKSAGWALIQQRKQFIRRPEARPHMIFIHDY